MTPRLLCGSHGTCLLATLRSLSSVFTGDNGGGFWIHLVANAELFLLIHGFGICSFRNDGSTQLLLLLGFRVYGYLGDSNKQINGFRTAKRNKKDETQIFNIAEV